MVTYLAHTVKKANKTPNTEESTISQDIILLSNSSLSNFEYTNIKVKKKITETGFLVVIPVRRITAKRDRKLLVKILSLSIVTSITKNKAYEFIVS
jgi:hypothetical protein